MGSDANATSSPWAADLDLITQAAQAAGERAMAYFRKDPEVWWKNEGRSPVSAADFAANDILKERLLSARPSYGWLSEETDDEPSRLSQDTLFVVDPIDGTRAFLAGKDVWCVSVAVVHSGRPVAGVLYAPALGELWQASLTGPALMNGTRVSVHMPQGAERLRLSAAEDMIAMLAPAYRTTVTRIGHVPSLAYRLAMVAGGAIDATIVKTSSHDWDLAAADLILSRAGGLLADMHGRALVYNRPDVTHAVLLATGKQAFPALLEAAGSLADH